MLLISISGAGGFTTVYAQTGTNGISVQVNGNVLSNGQFVYGPNIGDFNLKAYLHANAPHLDKYADELYGRAEYFSINPKVYLTLFELRKNLISSPDAIKVEDPFGFPNLDFISQIDSISETMIDAYYLHLYTYSASPPSQRNLPPFVTRGGEIIEIRSDTNAGTYTVIAALVQMETQQSISKILDNNQPDGFYQIYTRLFGQDDSLDEQNYIYVPGLSLSRDTQYLSEPMGAGPLTPPDGLLQLPYTRGQSWKFGGVHDNSGGGGVGSALNDASSMDFYPGGLSWDSDTSNMWVVAGAAGVPTKISGCYFIEVYSAAKI